MLPMSSRAWHRSTSPASWRRRRASTSTMRGLLPRIWRQAGTGANRPSIRPRGPPSCLRTGPGAPRAPRSMPLHGNAYGTAPTIIAAYQMIKGFEAARSHRHTPNALRFILESGPGTYTIVDGRKLPMEEGDVLLTPNWCWHGHVNEGAHNAYWIDVLDVPLTHLLGPVFFEPLDEGFIESAAEVAADSPFRFPFATWGAKTMRQPETRPGLREVTIGPPFLDSLRIKWRHLAAGTAVDEPQTTASCIYAVHSGAGTVSCDGHDFEWTRGDVFVIPAWRSARWQAGSESYLLRVSDESLLEKLNWLRTAES